MIFMTEVCVHVDRDALIRMQIDLTNALDRRPESERFVMQWLGDRIHVITDPAPPPDEIGKKFKRKARVRNRTT